MKEKIKKIQKDIHPGEREKIIKGPSLVSGTDGGA